MYNISMVLLNHTLAFAHVTLGGWGGEEEGKTKPLAKIFEQKH